AVLKARVLHPTPILQDPGLSHQLLHPACHTALSRRHYPAGCPCHRYCRGRRHGSRHHPVVSLLRQSFPRWVYKLPWVRVVWASPSQVPSPALVPVRVLSLEVLPPVASLSSVPLLLRLPDFRFSKRLAAPREQFLLGERARFLRALLRRPLQEQPPVHLERPSAERLRIRCCQVRN